MTDFNTSKNVPNVPIVNKRSIELNYDNKVYRYSDKNYYNSDKYTTPLFDLPQVIINGIKKFSTDDNANIEGDELKKFKQQVHEEFYLMNDSRFQARSDVGTTNPAVIKEAYLSKFDRLFEDYSEDNKITPEEYNKMLIMFLNGSYYDFKGLTEEIIDPNTVKTDTTKESTKKSFFSFF